jgi:ubiquinone/menaquinone biosynthesis C-methylase UbiE
MARDSPWHKRVDVLRKMLVMRRKTIYRNLVVTAVVCLLGMTTLVACSQDAPEGRGPTEQQVKPIEPIGSQGAPEGRGPTSYAAEMNNKFTNPQADVQEFVNQWESQSRDVYVKRHDIVRAVGLRPGDRVADIGAGTGLFTFLFADQVGAKGTVYAVDIAPAFVKYISEQARQRKQEGIVKPLLNTPESAELPADSIDVAFICDTYHHFEHPESMLASIRRAMRREGRLVVIDFDLGAGNEFVKKRARAPKEVYCREIAAAGFEQLDVNDAPAIKDNFYAAFRRVTHGREAKPATQTDEQSGR